MSRRDRGRHPRRPNGDAGVTLVELMVVLALMGTLIAIFTAGILQVYRATNQTDALADAQSQLHVAFTRLDKQVRYASWIRQPVETDDYHYVEFRGVDANSAPRCHRLVLDKDAGTVRLTRWVPGTQPAVGQVLASHVVAGPAAAFTVQEPGSQPFASPSTTGAGASFAPDFQRLRLRLTTTVGVGENRATTGTDITFTALNTSRTTVPGTDCTEGRPS